jgi:acetylornithine deacetylase/succinyl-diaminopimelate desuccinylase-like protein
MATLMQKLIDELINQVDPERLKQLTLDLVRIPSPPYEERAVAEFYASYLTRIGLAVELDDQYPTSPSVIARLYGTQNGPTLQLDGHTDTIELPGPDPCFANGYLYGRGSEDMKASLAAMAEAARVIVEAGVRLRGNLLLTAHGRHESATNETLESLIAKGVHGDAVIVTELGGHTLPIAGMGLAFFTLEISRDGEILHETVAPPETPHPIDASRRALELIHERAHVLAEQTSSWRLFQSLANELHHPGDTTFWPPKAHG